MITPFGELPNRLAVGMSLAEQHEWLHRPAARREASATAAAFRAVEEAAPRTARTGGPLVGRQLAYGPDPTTDMNVAFALDTPVSTASVSATVRAGSGSTEVRADIQTVPGTSTRYARSALRGLRSGTDYDYTVVADSRVVGTGGFRTADAGPSSFRFTAFGDQGANGSALAVLKQVAAFNPAFHLFAGDLSYADASGMGGPGDVVRPREWDRWIAQNDPFTSKIPFMCAPGNHDMEGGSGMHGYAGMLARVPIGGSSPVGIPVASTFRMGSVGFVGLDSNDVSYEIPANRGWTQGRQTAWLSETLKSMRGVGSGIDFVVAFMHAGPYSSNQEHPCEAGIRQAWVPLFDRYQVDLVISGHNHCYERTLPIRGGKPTAEKAGVIDSAKGTTYLTAGGGGAGRAKSHFLPAGTARVRDEHGNHQEAAPWVLPSDRDNAYSMVRFHAVPAARIGDQTELRAVTVDSTGKQVDSFVLTRAATVAASSGSSTSTAAGASATPAVPGRPDVLPWLLGGSGVVAAGAAVTGGLVLRARRIVKVRQGDGRPG